MNDVELNELKNSVAFMRTKFQEMIARCDGIDHMNKNMLKYITSMTLSIDESKKEYDDLSQKIKDFSDILEQEVKSLTGKIYDLKNEHLTLNSSHQDTKDTMNALDSSIKHIQSVVLDLKNSSKSFVKLENLEVISKNASDSHKEHSDNLSLIQEKFNELEDRNNRCSTNLTQVNVDLDFFKISKENFQNDIVKKFNLLQSQVKTSIDTNMENTLNVVADMISAIPSAPKLVIEDPTEKIKKQVEPIQLDAKNANLRSVNNESKITLLEKKVEQLQLLLNKYQIKQG